jgi:hypothetical protein
MYLVTHNSQGTTDYYGPFPSIERARTYIQSFAFPDRCTVEPMIIPYFVNISFKEPAQ